MKGARFWAVFMAALLTFSTLTNDYMVANAAEENSVVTEESENIADEEVDNVGDENDDEDQVDLDIVEETNGEVDNDEIIPSDEEIIPSEDDIIEAADEEETDIEEAVEEDVEEVIEETVTDGSEELDVQELGASNVELKVGKERTLTHDGISDSIRPGKSLFGKDWEINEKGWSSADNTVATVNTTGTVTAIAAGTTTVTFRGYTRHDNNRDSIASITYTITVTATATTPETDDTLPAGGNIEFVYYNPENVNDSVIVGENQVKYTVEVVDAEGNHVAYCDGQNITTDGPDADMSQSFFSGSITAPEGYLFEYEDCYFYWTGSYDKDKSTIHSVSSFHNFGKHADGTAKTHHSYNSNIGFIADNSADKADDYRDYESEAAKSYFAYDPTGTLYVVFSQKAGVSGYTVNYYKDGVADGNELKDATTGDTLSASDITALVNAKLATDDYKDYELDTSNSTSGPITINASVSNNVVNLYFTKKAVTERDVHYFVLLPGKTVPSNGSSQSTANYYPTGGNHDAAWAGKAVAVDNLPIYNIEGLDSDILTQTPDAAVNAYIKSKYPNAIDPHVVWYVYKNDDNKGDYHVDGYIQGIKVNVIYNANYGATPATYKDPDIETGNYTTLTYAATGLVTRPGYTFKGWSTTPDGKGDKYDEGAALTLKNSLVLYAQWEQVVFNVRYFNNKEAVNAAGTGAIDSKEYSYGDAVAAEDMPALPEADTTNQKMAVKWVNAKDDSDFVAGTTVTEDIDVYAAWTPYYLVTYRDYEGNNAVLIDEKYAEGTDVDVLFAGDNVASLMTRKGYVFAGWKDAEAETQIYANTDDGTKSFEINKNTTLDATFTPGTSSYAIEVYTQTTDSWMNGTKAYSQAGDRIVVEDAETESTVTVTDAEAAFAAAGDRLGVNATDKYEYDSSAADAVTEIEVVPAEDDEALPTIKLYFNIKTYQVNLDTNEPAGSGEADLAINGYDNLSAYYGAQNVKYDSKTIKYNLVNSTAFKLPTARLLGYSFKGWKIDSNWFVDILGKTTTNEEVAISKDNDGKTYVAQWGEGKGTNLYVLRPGMTLEKLNKIKQEPNTGNTVAGQGTQYFTDSVGTAKISGEITDRYKQYYNGGNSIVEVDGNTNVYDFSYKIGSATKYNNKIIDGNKLYAEYNGYSYTADLDKINWYVIKDTGTNNWHIDGEPSWEKGDPLKYNVTYEAYLRALDGTETKIADASTVLSKVAEAEQVAYNTRLSSVLSAPEPTAPTGYYFVGWTYKTRTDVTFAEALARDVMPYNDITIKAVFAEKTVVDIYAGEVTRTYNGEAQTIAEDVFTEASTAKISELTITGIKTTVQTGAINKGEYPITITGTPVVKGSAEETEKYTINLHDGKLIINPVKYSIVITANSNEAMYDGLEHFAKEDKGAQFTYTYKDEMGNTTPVDGLVVDATVKGSAVNVYDAGETTVTVNGVSFGAAADEAGNYEQDSVETVPGKVTITKRPVVLKAKSYTIPYNGFEQKIETYLNDKNVAIANRYDIVGEYGLAETDAITAVTCDGTVEIPKVYPNESQVVSVEINNQSASLVEKLGDAIARLGGEDNKVIDNYEITYNTSDIEVIAPAVKEIITITVNGYSGVYDGKRHYARKNLTDDYQYNVEGNFLGTDTLDRTSIEIMGSIVNPGKTSATVDGGAEAVRVIHQIGDDFEDVTDCYEVVVVPGTLTITEEPTEEPTPGDDNPGTPSEVTETETAATPLVPVADVLGARRGIEADDGSVLGARRIPGDAAVLGARRDATTSDANQMALYLMLMGIATGVGGAYTLGRRKKRQ